MIMMRELVEWRKLEGTGAPRGTPRTRWLSTTNRTSWDRGIWTHVLTHKSATLLPGLRGLV